MVLPLTVCDALLLSPVFLLLLPPPPFSLSSFLFFFFFFNANLAKALKMI